MRKNLLLLITAVLLSMGSAFAQAVEIDGIFYNLFETDAEVTSNPNGYSGNIVIPSTVIYEGATYDVTIIGSQAFYYCTALTSIILPNSIATIGSSAFGDCYSLTSITLPSSVTTIATGAFAFCIALTSIDVENGNANYSSIEGVLFNKEKTILICYPAGKTNSSYTVPNSVTSIGNYVFWACSALTSIIIPNSVTTIGSNFWYCPALTSIEVESENANYSSSDGILFDKEKTILICYPTGKTNSNYTIPNSVTTIGGSAFLSCSALNSVTLGNNVTTIGYYAFGHCTALSSVTLGNTVVTIGGDAFYNCTALTSVTLGNGITTIGDHAFFNCTALTSVTNLNPEPIEISPYVFYGVEISACTLKVLENSISDYQDAPIWQDFNIEGIVGIEDYRTPDISVYPNPTDGMLRITSDESQVTGIEIFDVSGRKLPMSTASLKSLETLIDISRLTTGLYFLKINTEAGQVIKKVLKE